MAGNATAESITTGAREAQNTLITASTEAANHVKSLATDVERTLTAVGADTAASILGSAREAQSSLAATSADAANQIKAIAADIERSLGVVTANTTDNIQTTRAERAERADRRLQRSQLQGQVDLGRYRALGARRQQQFRLDDDRQDRRNRHLRAAADRPSGADRSTAAAVRWSRRSAPRPRQLTTDIDRVTADALKSIETRGQAFSQSMSTHGSDVARTITSAGDLATGAVSKSLKDLEQASRSAIDQSRQVSIAAVTEMQETSKILRTDTVALFERLREGNILLQEVLTGAHDNLNSLERALVTRVADFVSAMNDVTSRNGVATQTLEDQLTVFNSKTVEGAGGSRLAVEPVREARQGAGRGRRAWSNRPTAPPPTSVAERKSQLESLVTTIDLRTTDLDQRLSRFTGLLDELLAAAEERARDIARVVAETAGAGSAAISRQFEAVRAAAENERQQTARCHERPLPAEHPRNGCDVQAVDREVRRDGAGHEADGLRDASTSSKPPATSCAAACSRCRRRPPRTPRRCAR